MGKTYIGIDNGVSGTIGIISDTETKFIHTPTIKVQDYTKAKKIISRLSAIDFYDLLSGIDASNAFAVIERPMVNPTRFAATASALRCHEAMLITIEILGIPYQFIDSKEWQREMLPKGYKDGETKEASLEIGNRLFPQLREFKHPDRDGILIAEYARRKNL